MGEQGKSREEIVESVARLTRELSSGLNRNGGVA